MSDRHDERNLTAAVKNLAAALERGLGDHPAPEELLDFVAGDLPEADRERIEDHLALCRGCARTALELAEDPELEAAPAGALLTEKELAAEWERFRGALAAAWPAGRTAATGRVPWALAASLLLAVVGLAVWNVQLREETRVLGEPRADVAVVDLAPIDAVERAPGEQTATVLPEWADRVVLLLSFADAATLPEYRIEVSRAGGTLVWSRRGVRRSAEGIFVLEVPHRLLPVGSYRIRLYGSQSPAAAPVAEYELEISSR